MLLPRPVPTVRVGWLFPPPSFQSVSPNPATAPALITSLELR